MMLEQEIAMARDEAISAMAASSSSTHPPYTKGQTETQKKARPPRNLSSNKCRLPPSATTWTWMTQYSAHFRKSCWASRVDVLLNSFENLEPPCALVGAIASPATNKSGGWRHLCLEKLRNDDNMDFTTGSHFRNHTGTCPAASKCRPGYAKLRPNLCKS